MEAAAAVNSFTIFLFEIKLHKYQSTNSDLIVYQYMNQKLDTKG